MSTKRGLSLSRGQRLLATVMEGRAPSLSTLQRHATAGALANCEVPGSPKRTLYDPDKLREHYRGWVEAETAIRQTRMARVSGGEGVQLRQDHIEQLARLAIAPVVAQIEQLSKEVAALNGLRASLMQKYDAAAALSFDRAERLAQQLADTRKLVDLDVRVARLAAEFSKLSELLRERAGATQ